MKTLKRGILGAVIIFTSTLQTFAIEGLKIAVHCPDVMLSWPSVEGEIYIVQYRPTMDPSTHWVMLTNLDAQTGTNLTFFIHSNIVQCSSGGTNGGGGGTLDGPPSPDSATSSESIDAAPSEPMAMPSDGSSPAVPLMLYPPGFDLSGLIILDPSTGDWVSGSGYEMPLPLQSANVMQLDDPQPLDDSSGDPDPGFYEVVKLGVTLYGLTDGMTISDKLQLPVEIGQLSGQLTSVTLEDSGVPIASSIHVAPFELPVPLLVLDTTLMSNGVHSISAHAQWTDPGDGTEDDSQIIYDAYSPAVSVTVSNEISFPNWIPQFGEFGNSLVVSAQSAHTNAQWYLDIYDSQFNYIGTLGGTTPDGNIYVVWDLVGPPPNYTLYTDNTFEFVLTTVYNDPVTTSAVVPNTYKITDPWSGSGDWVVVNQQAWNNDVGSDLLDEMTDGFVGTAQGFGLTVRPSASAGTAYRLRYRDANGPLDWANFRSALYNSRSRNLFYCGHGDPTGLGRVYGTNLSIQATEIATNLATIPLGLTNIHKYRFVCLDGCSTASGKLPESFGIIHKENVPASYYQDASVRPAAFAGWDYDVPIAVLGSINTSHVHFYQHFLYEWTANAVGVATAFDRAALYPDVTGIDRNKLKVFGYWNLGVNDFNQ